MSINPQAFMNGYLSGLRNGIITLSLGVAVYGFSRTFKRQNSKDIAKVVSIISYMVSLSISTLTTLQMRQYLNIVTEDEKRKMPKWINLKSWKKYEYIGWMLVSMGVLMLGLSVRKFAKRIFRL